MKRRKQIAIALIILIALFLEIFTIGKALNIFKESSLFGWEVKPEIPDFSLKGLWGGTWQTGLEKRLAIYLGLRPIFIRIDNQINYSLFDEISSKYPSRIILGNDKWLFEKPYIDSFNKLDAVPLAVLEKQIQSLGKLQTALSARGILFLFVITPSKASIYPEYINPKYLIPNRQEKETNYEKFIPLSDKYRINYLDGHQFFMEQKKESPYLLYPRSGTHWNYYSCYLFTVELIARLAKMLNKELQTIECKAITLRNFPVGSEKDLAEFSNIIFTKSLYGQYPNPEIAPSPNSKMVFHPKMLFVGTSYLWPLFNYMDTYQIYSQRVFYYYYAKKYLYPQGSNSPIDKRLESLQKEILSQDVIIIESNEAGLGDIGFGFVEGALKALEVFSK